MKQRDPHQGISGIFKIPFSNLEKSGKIDLFEKIRVQSGNFTMNQGKKIKEFRLKIYLLFKLICLKKIARAFGARKQHV